MPLREWRRLLAGSKVILAGGLEIICARPVSAPSGDARVGHGGRPVRAGRRGRRRLPVQLFPGFHLAAPIYLETLKAMTSLETLVPRPRAVQFTFRDVTAPGEDYRPLVPATGKELVFPMKLGPLPAPPGRANC